MKRVLIVDDDPDFVEVTRAVLERAGYEVTSAADGDEGMRRVRETHPDLIILDVIMKTVLDGLDMSRRMADSADLHDTPILMVTSIANSDYAALSGQIAGLLSALGQAGTGGTIDLAAVTAAAEAGAKVALDGLTLKAQA